MKFHLGYSLIAAVALWTASPAFAETPGTSYQGSPPDLTPSMPPLPPAPVPKDANGNPIPPDYSNSPPAEAAPPPAPEPAPPPPEPAPPPPPVKKGVPLWGVIAIAVIALFAGGFLFGRRRS